MKGINTKIDEREHKKNELISDTLQGEDKWEEDKDYSFVKRIYNYKYDLREVMLYWKKNIDKLSQERVNKKNIEKRLNKNSLTEEDINVKQVNKKEVRVKYDYKNPDSNIKTLIPLCNDILIIGKADS